MEGAKRRLCSRHPVLSFDWMASMATLTFHFEAAPGVRAASGPPRLRPIRLQRGSGEGRDGSEGLEHHCVTCSGQKIGNLGVAVCSTKFLASCEGLSRSSISSNLSSLQDLADKATKIHMSSDLKVLVGDLYKSGHCMYISGFAKVPR